MKPNLRAAGAAFALATTLACVPAGANPAHGATADGGEGTALAIVRDLTTDIGQRLAGSDREAAAREWAAARLRALGLANVRIEPFAMRGYVRGEDSARLVAPVPQRLAVTALGYSPPTPPDGLSGELVYLPTLDALRALPPGALSGKIAFIDHAMRANQDGSGYGPYGNVRREGPALAKARGAIGVLIRSAGTDHNRDPHTGVTSFAAGDAGIPAGAVSIPDAELIARTAAAHPGALRVALRFTGHPQEGLPSGNVIGEIPGSDPALPPVLIGCHLDSWDLATGAIDDGAGCAIVTAAALRTRAAGQPLRTIRVLWAGSEEVGGFGGEAYARAHAGERHALAMESDFGADRVWRVRFNLAAANAATVAAIKAALGPLGIVSGTDKAGGGTDVEPVIAAQALPVIDLDQDGTRYFDLHHTPDDTFDKIDPAQLEQNVEAWSRVLRIVANARDPLAAQP